MKHLEPSLPMSSEVDRPKRIESGLSGFVNSIADAGVDLFLRRKSIPTTKIDKIADIRAECNELLSTLGEATGTALARSVLQAYLALDITEKNEFFKMLRSEFHIDGIAIYKAAKAYVDTNDDTELTKLLSLSESPRQELFRRLNMAPNGTKALIEMRGSLLSLMRDDKDLQPVDDDMRHLFSSWFNRGFLKLKSIDWESPAVVLEKLIENESVHEMRGWDDLQRRLAHDRRCFAFFHSALPNEPLVFVEVALVNGLAASIDPIIKASAKNVDTHAYDTAIFYSINNCLEGLVGVSFGNFLIKQVVIELQRDFPELKVFSTLSPIPGFRKWFEEKLARYPAVVDLSKESMKTLIDIPATDWSEAEVAHFQPILTKWVACYLTQAKRKSYPLDPVARFHLRNGARLERKNWLGDTSDNRLRESYGFLVNYVYDSEDIVANHETYIKSATVVTSEEIMRLAEQAGASQ